MFLITRKITYSLIIAIIIASAVIVKAQGPVLSDPVVEKIADGFNFIEGPVWVKGLGLFFSDIPESKIYLFDLDSNVTTYKTPSGKSNGLALDADTNLLLAQHFDRQIGRLESDMSITPLATHYNGLRLNSPNDLTVKSDGSIFFTDPPFGLNDEGGTSELGYAGIYRLTAKGDVQLLDNSLNYPNGIVFSPDESKLYVTESDVADVYVWDVVDDTTIASKTLFFNIPGQWGDGMKVDQFGYLYVTGPNGVRIFHPDGSLVNTIYIPPGKASNCGWGEDMQTLYVTSEGALYRIRNQHETPPVDIDANIDMRSDFPDFTNYPNPFNGSTTISYYLPDQDFVRLKIYDTTGKEIITLVDNEQQAGYYSLEFDANNYTEGAYLCKLLIGEELIKTKKMLLFR